jgi:DNA replication and repair protein RecF
LSDVSGLSIGYTYRVIIKSLGLTNFRNYQEKRFELSEKVNVIYGDNGSGKTNMLEAISLLSVGLSFKAGKVEEMIRFGEEVGRVESKIEVEREEMGLEIVLTGGVIGGKKVAKRKYLVEGVSKRRRDFVGLLAGVLFRPEDLELMDGTPSIRRKFLDWSLIKVDSEYERHLSTYEQALRRRNKLLDAIREGVATRYALTFWDGLLIKHGQELERMRMEYLDFMNQLWSKSDLFNKLKINYDRSGISEARLKQYKEEEVAVGYTLVGPHKDDFRVVTGEGRELSVYGSRGEQRMAVLALKMGELYYVEAMKKIKPVLLLDDIFSELDEAHREEVLRVTEGRQVIVTTAEESEVGKFKMANLISLS